MDATLTLDRERYIESWRGLAPDQRDRIVARHNSDAAALAEFDAIKAAAAALRDVVRPEELAARTAARLEPLLRKWQAGADDLPGTDGADDRAIPIPPRFESDSARSRH